MAGSIDHISDKYLVVKRDDIKKYLNDNDKDALYRMMSVIAQCRANDSKPRSNEYVVLNMEDEFHMSVFYKESSKMTGKAPRKVRDYAVALVNTILFSKK